MKKNFVYAMLSAIALTGAVGVSSCSSSDEVINNPNYNPETNTVKTQFAISIPSSGNQASTRMDADGAPGNGVFKGMKEIKLYPISSVNSSTKVADESCTITAPIGLGEIAETGGFNEKGYGDNSFNGKVYEDVAIPVGTKAFLFYGEIADEKGGDLTPTYGTTGETKNISFALSPIQNATFANLNNADGTAVLAALNGIVGELNTQQATASTEEDASAIHLNALFQTFTSLKAGSANTVRAFVQNVYNMLSTIGTAHGITYTASVKDKIEDYFTVSGTAPNQTLRWKEENIFPNNMGLPDGAIGVNYTTSFAFASVTVNGNQQPELNTYVKPASLFYTVNTPIHTSTEAQVSRYSTKTKWDDVVALYTSGTSVVGETRGIVLDKPIQYGVGRLASTVQLNSTLKAYDKDGIEAVVSIPSGGYTISGLLIGTQYNVDWKFEPVTGTTYTIYDPVQTAATSSNPVKASTTASATNYTLALQTPKDDPVRIVVEFVNDGDDFYGIENQLIPKGSKFYLIALLDPTAATGYGTGDDDTKNRVFCQDVETTVNFKVGEMSLKKAYNTIPDLRSPKMELGLSVDLSWTPGLSFGDVTLGQ
jgi:hypothetical protein